MIRVSDMYSREIQNMLKKKKIEIGDSVEVKKEDNVYSGTLMPRIDMGDRNALVIKLDNGYNVGMAYSKEVGVTLVSKGMKEPKKPFKPQVHDKSKPKISILSMGGTIASRVDYKTGGVIPSFTAEDLVDSVPELAEMANIHGRQVENILSENMKFSDYKKLAKEIQKEVESGCDGILVTHGTDTLHYTACALAFALEELPVPVVLVGSQRSSDRASSDGPFNLICAVRFLTETDFGEVGLCMHATESDDFCLVYPACKARKMHTSRRDAFKSVNSTPWALVSPEGNIRFFREDYRKRDASRKLNVKSNFEDNVALLKAYPDMEAKIMNFFVKEGYKGLVLEGTGLGHVPKELYKGIQAFLKKGIVVMTSQCLNGRINMNVYSTGRELEEMGVIPGEDMTAETAYIKLAWLLGNYKKREEAERLLRENLRGEINDRSEF